MANITTDSYLDTAAGTRTAGESWILNGATLTIRTDTRWYQGAPTGMTGSLGAIQTSGNIGGGVVIDATKVRWMPFNSGSGTVPAINSTITQGDVSGTLLGVWPGPSVAPLAVGSAMPATGYLKFLEVTGGQFSEGALTGISAVAAGPDVVGWIEVVMDGVNITTTEMGTGMVTKGDWFELGTTNGSASQTIYVPTNGGGAGTHVFGVQIETAPGSAEYEWYATAHGTLGAAAWSSTHINTDIRSKIVESNGNGYVRIGANSDQTRIGYIPPAGCKIRIPNIFLRTVAAAARAVNIAPGSGTRCTMRGGNYTLNNVHCDFASTGVDATVKAIYKNSAFDSLMQIQDNATDVDIDNVCIGGYTGAANYGLRLQRVNGGKIKNLKIVYSGTTQGAFNIATASNLVIENVEVINFKSRTGLSYSFNFASLNASAVRNVRIKGGGGFTLSSCDNLSIESIDYIDRLEGNTTTIQPREIYLIASCTNCTFSGLTFGENGALSNTQCYGNIMSFSASPSYNIKLRNIGSRAAPLDCGNVSTLYPSSLISIASGSSGIKVQKVFLSGLRSAMWTTPSNTTGIHFEDVFTAVGQFGTPYGSNAIYRKIGSSTENAIVTNANLGTHWIDAFLSDTTGIIKWLGVGTSAATSAKNYMEAAPSQGTGYITSTAAISMDTIGDAAYSEIDYWLLGHTGFQNVAPVISSNGTGVTVQYDLDVGTGFRGTWTVANAANLSSEVLNPAGTKMKLKIEVTGPPNIAGATNLQSIKFATTSTLEAQANNVYPLDTVTLSFEGLKPGSEVRVFLGEDPETAVEIAGTESVASDTWSFTHNVSGQKGYIMIFAMGYQPIMIPRTFSFEDSSLLIQQVIDRNYKNPA